LVNGNSFEGAEKTKITLWNAKICEKLPSFKGQCHIQNFHCQIDLSNAKNMIKCQTIILLPNAFKNIKIMPNFPIYIFTAQSAKFELFVSENVKSQP